MAEYIERETAISLLKNRYQDMSAMSASYYAGFQYALQMMEKIKPATAVPVVHGKWVERKIGRVEEMVCSMCGCVQEYDFVAYRYCPNCGAKMDLED